VLSLLPKQAKYYFTQAQIPRALLVEELKTKAEQYGLKGKSFKDVNNAYTEALSVANTKDVIVVCGSFFIIAELDAF
jgi:dihydrofolate synthase / folylpolyglutamate synthase